MRTTDTVKTPTRRSSQDSTIDSTKYPDIRMIDRTDLLHGSHDAIGLRKTPSPSITIRTEYDLDSPKPPSVREENRECCAECKFREEKIKSDYDRMILFSKKDRVSGNLSHFESPKAMTSQPTTLLS